MQRKRKMDVTLVSLTPIIRVNDQTPEVTLSGTQSTPTRRAYSVVIQVTGRTNDHVGVRTIAQLWRDQMGQARRRMGVDSYIDFVRHYDPGLFEGTISSDRKSEEVKREQLAFCEVSSCLTDMDTTSSIASFGEQSARVRSLDQYPEPIRWIWQSQLDLVRQLAHVVPEPDVRRKIQEIWKKLKRLEADFPDFLCG